MHLINMGFFIFHSGQGGNGRWVAYLEFPVVRSALISCEKTSVYKNSRRLRRGPGAAFFWRKSVRRLVDVQNNICPG